MPANAAGSWSDCNSLVAMVAIGCDVLPVIQELSDLHMTIDKVTVTRGWLKHSHQSPPSPPSRANGLGIPLYAGCHSIVNCISKSKTILFRFTGSNRRIPHR